MLFMWTAYHVTLVASFSIPDILHLHIAATSAAASTAADVHNHAAPHLKHAAHSLPRTKTAMQTVQHVNLLEGYRHLLKAHPLATKMLTGSTLAVGGDAIAQSNTNKNTDEPYDKRRAASFAVFDMAYRALQHVSFPVIVAACHGQYLGSVPGLSTALEATQRADLGQPTGDCPLFVLSGLFCSDGRYSRVGRRGCRDAGTR